MTGSVTLDRAPLGTPLVLLSTHPDGATARRLASLGLRRGVRVTLMLPLAGGGRVVNVGGGRVAVSRRVLAALQAEVA